VSNNQLVISKQLDCRETFGPLQVVELRRAINTLQGRQVLELISTDPNSLSDFPAWCRSTGHELIEMRQRRNEFTFYIRKSVQEP
jgi:TusA-related sulfurtransferase